MQRQVDMACLVVAVKRASRICLLLVCVCFPRMVSRQKALVLILGSHLTPRGRLNGAECGSN